MPDPLGQTEPNLPPARRSLSRGVWAIGCLGSLAVVLALGALSVWFYFRGRHQQAIRAVQAEVARIHAAGQPITTDDMVAHHRVPDGVFDATPLWMDAIKAAATTKTGSEARLPIVGEGKQAALRADAPASLLPLAEQFLAAHAATIEKTRAAAAAGGQCRYPVEFAQGINAKLTHMQDARMLARVLSLRLHVAVERGDVAAAAESLQLQLALAATMEHEPLLISQLVRIALVSIALDDVRQIVGELPLSEPQLAELQQQLAAIAVQRPIKDGMIGERAMGFHTFHHLSQLEGVEMLAGKDGTLQRPGDCLFYLDLMQEMVEAADTPPDQARHAAKQVENKLKGRMATQNPLDRLEIVVTMRMFPATGAIYDASARTQALRDSAVAGIAFRRYQLKHGSPPKSLEALVPEFLPAVPRDPFAVGNPPHLFIVEGDQFAIYSVGMNLQDDRALLRDPESNDDVGFVARLTVPRADGTHTLPSGVEK
jgi:hypothetical protein